MPIIRKLPESLVLKIAAGEVIERPFSVVKELVENAIDAGAHDIHIAVEDGGRKSILIQDDGCGMSREEALLALERHATSKLSTDEDLFHIKTLGFRGEALPSIAAVSFMILETRVLMEEVGTKTEIEGRKIIKIQSSSLPKGTRISVQNLFFNTPARLKFMKSRETEFSHIASWVEAIALSRSDIGFRLDHNGKTELRSDATSEMRTRIGDVLGVDIAEFLHPVDMNRGGFILKGFVSDHRASSTLAKSLYFFVNGRFVRDRTLQHAVLSAYETLLMKHRYPWAVLQLQVPEGFVDVNVHPAKSEVRFVNGNSVHEFVKSAVRQILENKGQVGTGMRDSGCAVIANEVKQSPDYNREIATPFGLAMTPTTWARRVIEATGSITPESLIPEVEAPSIFPPTFKILGQVHGTYLLCETSDSLILIDQHAAHERIGFEQLRSQLKSGGIEKQQLLIPQNFDLLPSQAEILKKYLGDLVSVGLEVEFFGGNTFILRTVPVLLEGTDIVSLIEELIESLQSFEKLTPFEERLHEVLERMACHRQVRAGDRLSLEEIQTLIDMMRTSPHANQCPHGRPSVLSASFSDIEKWFKRKL